RLRYAPSSKTIHSTQARGEINPEIGRITPSRAFREDRQRRQSRLELLERETAMAHMALRLAIELAECAAERSVEKQRVVAEAVGAVRLESYAPRTFGAKKPLALRRRERERADEAGAAPIFRQAGELIEEFPGIARIVGTLAAVARRVNSRRAAERVDLQPRIVGQRRQAGECRDRPRFFERILLVRRAVLDDLRRVGKIFQ